MIKKNKKIKNSIVKDLFSNKYLNINLIQVLIIFTIIVSLIVSFIPIKLTQDTQKEGYDLIYDLVELGSNSNNPQDAIYESVISENVDYSPIYTILFIYLISFILFILCFVCLNSLIDYHIFNKLGKKKRNFLTIYKKSLILTLLTITISYLFLMFVFYIITNSTSVAIITISSLILVISLVFLSFLGFNILQTILLINKNYLKLIKQKIYYLCKLSLIQSFSLIILTNLCYLIEYFIPFVGFITFLIIFSMILNYSRIYLRELL